MRRSALAAEFGSCRVGGVTCAVVDSVTRVFWGLVIVLFGASAYFGFNAQAQRRAIASADTSLSSGDVVSFEKIVDGDTVIVKNSEGESASVRLVGIKSFPLSREAPEVFAAARAATQQLSELLAENPARIELHSTPKDSHGRFLAYLYVEDRDVGLELVKSGAVLVYTLYPFDKMADYLSYQEKARSKKRGLWRSQELARRADALLLNWRMQQ